MYSNRIGPLDGTFNQSTAECKVVCVVHRERKTLLQLRKIEERALTTISSNMCGLFLSLHITIALIIHRRC